MVCLNLVDVNSVLTEVLLKAAIQPILLSSKMAMEHAMVIVLLHSNVGMEIGMVFYSHFIQPLLHVSDIL